MKITYQHPALRYHDPITGVYNENEDANENGVIDVTAAYEVCGSCRGHGTHFRSDLDESHLIGMMEEDCVEDGLESYHKGHFDQVCTECNGNRVVAKPNLPQWAEELINDWEDSARVDRAIAASERRMGA